MKKVILVIGVMILTMGMAKAMAYQCHTKCYEYSNSCDTNCY